MTVDFSETGLLKGTEALTSHDRKREWLACSSLLFIMAVLCAVTWGRWGTLTIDCGREMYIPAALSKGKALYFDAWYPYGPLIPYWHGLLFRLFGVHLWILEAAGIAAVGVTTLFTYRLSRLFLPLPLSFLAGFAVIIQAFQFSLFNYVLPYSYPATYASMMFVILVWILISGCLHEKSWTMFAAGCIAGLQALTKIEFGAAAYILLACALLIRTTRYKRFYRFTSDLGAYVPGLLLCLGVYGWYVHASSVEFMFGQNIPVLPQSYFVRAFGPLFAQFVGFTTSPVSLLQALFVGLAGVTMLVAAAWHATASRRRGFLLAAASVSLCVFYLANRHYGIVHSRTVNRVVALVMSVVYFNPGMVVITAAFSIYVLVRWYRARFEIEESTLVLLFVASFAIGTRTLVHVDPTFYSIYYDLVPFIAFLFLTWELARRLGIRGSSTVWGSMSVFLCFGLASLTVVAYAVHHPTFLLRTPVGSIYTERDTGVAFQDALTFLSRAQEESKKFVVWPEEAALYVFTGQMAPSRWYIVDPGILPPGKLTSDYLAELDKEQVKYVALSNRATPEYEVPIFGVDYNQALYVWLQQNFRVVRTFGSYQRIAYPPSWAVQIWERNTSRPGR